MQYIIGIDLGTTNSVLAYAEANDNSGSLEPEKIQLLPIKQLVAANTTETKNSLPSFSYLANAAESTGGAFDLPWASDRSFAVGQYARSRGVDAPDRTVGASKSWLCHQGVDRRAKILPWNAPDDVAKISPVAAAQQYLQHLADAWKEAFPDAPLAQQQVVLTVPASFDPVARELTREAATDAGLPNDFVFLEEPQAALYAWLNQQGDQWRNVLKCDDCVLVCDVGGGTTDLTLIRVQEDAGALELQRSAVGDHLLVGGDNMDLATAHFVAGKFAEGGTELNPWQSVSLWHSCRAAKEQLLSTNGPATHPIAVLGRGSKLIASTVSVDVAREDVADLLMDGFFPRCSLADSPQRQPMSGFQEIGLPFESDPAITRHIAAFVKQHCGSELPNHVLFNGGVFKADGFRQRLLDVINSWSNDGAESSVVPLAGGQDLDYSVARGACFYGCNKHNGGLRIRGGVGNSYYVGIETAGLAIPGAPRPLKALCVVPFGMEEGTENSVESNPIGLVVGQPVSFRFFSSKTRHEDSPGQMLDRWTADELVETDPLLMTLTVDGTDETFVPVTFDAKITELGMFELWCVSATKDGDEMPRRWKLEFNVRGDQA